MAQRRMFSKTITNSGKFLKMPPTSRLLYYDLGMNADDDGYTEWFTIIRMSGSTEQDLHVLQANGFVKIYDDNVLVILDWKENNLIRSDRYTPSKYLGKYEMSQIGIPNDNQMDTQVRLGKVRLGKDTDTHDFATFWDIYPRKVAKKEAWKVWRKLSMTDELLQKILTSVQKQSTSDQWLRDGGKYVPYPSTWLNQERWNDEIEAQTIKSIDLRNKRYVQN